LLENTKRLAHWDAAYIQVASNLRLNEAGAKGNQAVGDRLNKGVQHPLGQRG
jgi:hypothetical protein